MGDPPGQRHGRDRVPEKGNAFVEGTGVRSPAKVGDVFFIPANLTHGPNEVKEPLFWLNVRWDVNWAQK